ncbi:21640_t:CDS:2 [Gigaspora margarita]|uniref:21640_t:CDS:1 n=1 Tax=Gigaspora margarita TaxID=4874 RepID=A0ABN7UPH6_GIGMA|nr:21640_t:CDS:2 [Gigaspora margarita]
MPLLPHSKHNCPLVNLSDFRDRNSSHYLLDPTNFLTSILSTKVQISPLSSEALFPTLCYDFHPENTELIKWYSFLDYGTVKVEVDEFTSNADDIIDEVKRQFKIKKEKSKPLSIRCYSDEAGNTYLQESNAQPDPQGYITLSSKARSSPVSDLFDYIYEEQQDPYQLGKLEPEQHFHIQQFIALLIKQYPYWHSLAEKDIIKQELIYMLTKKIIRPSRITGTYLISADTITYQKDPQSTPVPINDIKQESDADRLHHRMPEFLDDLRSITHDLRDVEVPLGQN